LSTPCGYAESKNSEFAIMTCTGKIARLPYEIRDQLNRRLRDGEPGRQLVAWLNGQPEVQRVLATGFGGRPINEPNLCAWKAGGYQSWLAQQEALTQACELPPQAAELTAAANGQVTTQLATVLAVRYATELMRWKGEASGEFSSKLRALRGLSESVTQLRRGVHEGDRLKLQHEQLEWQREKMAQPKGSSPAN
jgi:hypothetical protein